jgi:hypothetical protein
MLGGTNVVDMIGQARAITAKEAHRLPALLRQLVRNGSSSDSLNHIGDPW